MTQTMEILDDLISRGDSKKLGELIAGMPVEERHKYSNQSLKWLRKASQGDFQSLPTDIFGKLHNLKWRWDLGEETLKTSLNAVLLTADDEQLSKFNWDFQFEDYIDWPLLEELKPPALKNFAETIVKQGPHRFPIVRELIDKGLSEKPDSDEYYIAMIGFPMQGIYTSGHKNLKSYLLHRREILEDVWGIFGVEGTPESSLAAHDKFCGENAKWAIALAELSNEGHISRDRLLDMTHEALGRDYIQFRSGWFSRLHESLNPTLQERIDRQESYFRLLGSAIPSTVSFAIKSLKKISSKKPLSSELLKLHVSPALVARSKTTVTGAMTLIEKTMKKDRDFRKDGCLLLAEVLINDSPDVQKKCVDLLNKYGPHEDVELRQKIIEYRDFLVASLASSLDDWITSAQPDISTNLHVEEQSIYEYNPHACEGWPLKFAATIEPIETLEELLGRAAFCLENHAEVAEMERVVEAVARLPLKRDEQFAIDTGAIRKRAHHFYKEESFPPPMQQYFAGFIYDWLNESEYILHRNNFRDSLVASQYFLRELWESILERINQGTNLPLLCSPTHEGGWLDPAVLSYRYSKYVQSNQEPSEAEMVVALLSCPDEETGEFLKETSLKGPLIDALMFSVGISDNLPDHYTQLSTAARHLREPFKNDRKYLDFSEGSIFCSIIDFELARWFYAAMPRARSTWLNSGLAMAKRCVWYMDATDSRLAASLERLSDPGAPLDIGSSRLMAAGLMLPDPQCNGLACDAIIAAIDDRRLSLDLLGQGIAETLDYEKPKPKRLADSLKEIARIGPLHSNAIRRVIEMGLTGDGSQAPKGISHILEVYNELLAQDNHKLDNADTISYLRAIKTGGKTGKLIKQILA